MITKTRLPARRLLLGARLTSMLSILLLVGAGVVSPQAAAATDEVIIRGFPLVEQSYSLSCEYASAAVVTRYWGRLVSEDQFISAIAANPNPHRGFRGNINGSWGGITNYGIYAEPLA